MAQMLPFIAMVASAAGTVMQSQAQRQAAETERNLTIYNRAIAERQAKAEEASSQQAALEIKRQANLKKSRVLALAAASGGSALDPDIMNAIAGFEEEGDLAARTALYEGTESAKSLRSKGYAIQYEGLSRANALRNRANATILEGASSLYSKYGAYKS